MPDSSWKENSPQVITGEIYSTAQSGMGRRVLEYYGTNRHGKIVKQQLNIYLVTFTIYS